MRSRTRRRRRDGCDNASMSGRRPSPHTPAARSRRAPRTREPRPVAEQRASPLSGIDVLQNGDIQHRLGEQLLQLAVLILQSLQPPGIGHVETAQLGLPLADAREKLERWRRDYNEVRPHGAIGNKSLITLQNGTRRSPKTQKSPAPAEGALVSGSEEISGVRSNDSAQAHALPAIARDSGSHSAR